MKWSNNKILQKISKLFCKIRRFNVTIDFGWKKILNVEIIPTILCFLCTANEQFEDFNEENEIIQPLTLGLISSSCSALVNVLDKNDYLSFEVI